MHRAEIRMRYDATPARGSAPRAPGRSSARTRVASALSHDRLAAANSRSLAFFAHAIRPAPWRLKRLPGKTTVGAAMCRSVGSVFCALVLNRIGYGSRCCARNVYQICRGPGRGGRSSLSPRSRTARGSHRRPPEPLITTCVRRLIPWEFAIARARAFCFVGRHALARAALHLDPRRHRLGVVPAPSRSRLFWAIELPSLVRILVARQ